MLYSYEASQANISFRLLFTFISMAIDVSSNQTIMPSEGVFQWDVSKLNDLLILDTIQQVRLRNKRPDSSTIFTEISKAHATNFTQEDIENRIEGLINEKKAREMLDVILLFVTSFVKEAFTETDTEPISILFHTNG